MRSIIVVMVGVCVEGSKWGLDLPFGKPITPEDIEDSIDDAWMDKWADYLIYKPQPGDLVIKSDTDYRVHWIGEIVCYSDTKWEPAVVFATFTPEQLAEKCDTVHHRLVEHFGVHEQPHLHIVTLVH